MPKPSALIVSVGATPAPVVVALREVAPRFACFLVSHQSVEKIPEIKREAGVSVRDEKVVVDDPEDLVACYRKAVECLQRARANGFEPGDIVVDYTGGTKAMTAALAMAAASHGVAFSYVGGERGGEGLGVVEAGKERRRVEVDPLRLFAVEEKRRVALYFNHYQYGAAAAALRELIPSQREPERSLLTSLLEITEAYAAWDRFDHASAFVTLPKARTQLEDRARVAEAADYDGFLQTILDNVRILGELKGRSGDFTRPHPSLAGDLVANADRRMAEGKCDDAVARLYRTMELLGQCAFEETFAMPTDRVAVERLPPVLRENFARKYSDDGVTAKLALAATFQVLAEVGHAAGRRFAQTQEDFRKIMDARNGSILAHGMRPVAESAAKRLRELVASFLPPDAKLPQFPRLPW